MVTLFDQGGDLDLGANKELYGWLAEHDVDGAFVAGTTGEFTALTDDERLDLCTVAASAFGPTRTYWHVGAASTRQAVALARQAVDRGAQLLAAVTPYYMPAGESALLNYYDSIVRATPGVPVFGYLFTARTTVAVSPDLLARLVGTGLAGVKISGEPHAQIRRYVEQLGADRPPVFSGADGEFADVLRVGGAGVVSGVSTALPGPFLELRDSLRSGDADGIGRAQDRARRAIEATRGGNLAHLKAALELQGLPPSTLRAPVDPISAKERSALAASIEDVR